MKIQEGDAHHITCPGFDCCMLVPVEIIENVVSRDMARRYLQFDIKVQCNILTNIFAYIVGEWIVFTEIFPAHMYFIQHSTYFILHVCVS